MIKLPQFVMLPRKTKADKRVNLWQNTMHNVDRFTYNAAKIEFKRLLEDSIATLPRVMLPIHITYIYFAGTKRLGDISNHCVFVDKFFSDALTESGYIPDDNYQYIRSVMYKFGWVDKEWWPYIIAEIKSLGTPKDNLGFTWWWLQHESNQTHGDIPEATGCTSWT